MRIRSIIRSANFVCCAVTMAETDRHVRVAPKTLRWNLQASAKSVQITTPRKLFGGGYSSAVRLESQFFSFGFCCPGKVWVQWHLSLPLPFFVAHSCISVSSSPWSCVRVLTTPKRIIRQLSAMYTTAIAYAYNRTFAHTGPRSSRALRRDSLWRGWLAH